MAAKEGIRFGFRNDLIFKRVMRDEEICRGVIERIFGWKVGRVVFNTTEYEVFGKAEEKSIRLDAYVVEEKGDGSETQRVYDIEMQTTRQVALAKRMRLYQSKLDGSYFPMGSSYGDIKESYIVFICTAEPFAGDNAVGLPVYTIERRCIEAPELDINCGAHWIAINASAFDRVEDAALSDLLRYISTDTVAEGDSLISKIDERVADLNGDRKLVGMLSTIAEHLEDARIEARRLGREMGLEEGRAAGLEEGLAEGLEEGRAEGLEEGRAQERKLLGLLSQKLKDAGRSDEITGALEDDDVLSALLAEFDLESN